MSSGPEPRPSPLLLFYFEVGFHRFAQAGLELGILLPSSPKYLGYRLASPGLTSDEPAPYRCVSFWGVATPSASAHQRYRGTLRAVLTPARFRLSRCALSQWGSRYRCSGGSAPPLGPAPLSRAQVHKPEVRSLPRWVTKLSGSRERAGRVGSGATG